MERWQQIEFIFHEALERQHSEREAYVHYACAGDRELHREVTSLLASYNDDAEFGAWAAAAAAKVISASGRLQAGEHLGPYEIRSFLAAGGMGEVYNAHDPRTGREVAIKVCADRFGERFEREVRTIAALNHPNICTLFDVGPNYLVMELVEGESPKGPLPVETALNYALQIADALEYAHEKGVVHRDLKPANIKITSGGTVRVLDFGLAKTLSPSAHDRGNSPTLSIASTDAGVILGTDGYMSPEQARGKPVDKRTDIWAFGVVLYEMLTAERLFEGETVSDTLTQVLTKEPDLSRVPAKARKLLRRCFEKDPRRRLRDIGEARFLLEDEPQTETPAPAKAGGSKLPMLAAAGLATAIGLGFVAYLHFNQETNVPSALKLSVVLPENTGFDDGGIPAISPDGRWLAFSATVDGQQGLWVRDLTALATRLLPGSDGARYPFWSADSRWIGFFTTTGKLKKIEVAGGSAITICNVERGRGGTWNQSDQIVYGTNAGGLFRVSATAGSAPVPLSTLDRSAGETSHVMPWFLPDGRHFLYTARNSDLEKIRVYVADLKSASHTKDRLLVLAANSNAIYAPPGYLLFVRDRGTLMAQPFDAGKAQVTGEAVPIAENVNYYRSSIQAEFSASKTGVVVYASGGLKAQLTWFDRAGRPLRTVGPPGEVAWAAISPDGSRVAYDRRNAETGYADIWLHDLVAGTDAPFTFGPHANSNPVWSPDANYVAFTPGGAGISRRATTGSGQDERLDDTVGPEPGRSHGSSRPSDWSQDYLIETRNTNRIWLLPMNGEKKPFVYHDTEFSESDAVLSPNGRWLAYSSDASKRSEIYVETFPMPEAGWQISVNGGSLPRWSRDGKELYFIAPDQKLMAVEIKAGPRFERSVPKSLFPTRLPVNGRYDVSKDGRFLIPTLLDSAGTISMTAIVNWTAGLKK